MLRHENHALNTIFYKTSHFQSKSCILEILMISVIFNDIKALPRVQVNNSGNDVG